MEKVQWIVEGMTCSNCALTVNNYLQKQGLEQVKVNPINGEVSFQIEDAANKPNLIKGIGSLGYQVVQTEGEAPVADKRIFKNHRQRLLFCLIFTVPLMLHMFDRWIHIHWLMNPYVQLALCLPVFIAGMDFFARSAIKSIRNGYPNMNVLVTIGAVASFAYSLTGTILNLGPDYLFYETTASIITLVLFGNYLEDVSIQTTQRAIRSLARSQKVMANMIAFDGDHQELIFPVENTVLKHGDLVLIKSGEQVPADGKILWGDAGIDESIITGESLPVEKHAKDTVIGGSVVVDGTLKVLVTAEARDSVLSNIINLVNQAQGEKMEIRKLADKISAIFVPVVLVISLITFVINYLVLGSFADPLMRSIAVLVIACPCAMGLATPAAIAVGLGRAAKNGVLFRHAQSLELFKDIRQVVFDKTGTLTTGHFVIDNYKILNTRIDDDAFKRILFSIEKYSNHPIAKSISSAWRTKNEIRWAKVEEIKGSGMQATDKEGNIYMAGSYTHIIRSVTPELKDSLPAAVSVVDLGSGANHGSGGYLKADKTATVEAGNGDMDGLEDGHNLYLTINGELAGWVDMKDEIRPEAKQVVSYLKSKGIKTWLLSGDRKAKSILVAKELGIDKVMAEQSPAQKADFVGELTAMAPTAMVGDGINDAPALAKATIGVSMADASQIAIETGDVILMNKGLKNLPLALGLGKHTYLTIKQNLFWAFIYNIVAIPVAAVGLLTPTFGALVMGLSDVVLAVNSVRLFVKKVV
ncbi:heavy metal translocating P-type ATPase [Flavitalea sp.]|nr:cation-translocating P-type ATPase [Flavitalea sp.]